jgi:hypothetical protein
VGAATLACSLAIASAQASTGFTTKGAWSFVSAPGLHPPRLRTDMRTVSGKLAPGYFMLANLKDLALPIPMAGQGGPLIVDRNLQPVWFKPVLMTVSKSGSSVVGNNATSNLREQTYQGKPVLSWWQGSMSNVGVTLKGQDMVVNQHYQPVATLTAQGPAGCAGAGCWVVSEHEFLIRGHDAWVTVYRSVPMNLTKYGGPANGMLLDTGVQEYDLTKPGSPPLFTWDAMNHIAPSKSHTKPINGLWDAYHENSISLGKGTFLVSMRNEWTAYQVNESTGKILWTIGGDPKLSTFKVPSNARFQWQHDVQLHPGNVLSVFDDHCCNVRPGQPLVSHGPAQGLVLKLNLSKHTATLVHAYSHGFGFRVPFLGNTQLVPGGNVVVGWGTGYLTSINGSVNVFTEYTNGGARVLDARIPNPDLSYRTYLQRWVGLPLTPPSGAVRKSKGGQTVYASWNGATQVRAWRVLAGSTQANLKTVISRASKTGFETAIRVSGSHKWFEIQALAPNGRVLSSSKPFAVQSPALHGAY